MNRLTTPSAPPAGGQPAGTPESSAAPSSGETQPGTGEQKAADKAPTGTPTPEQPAGKTSNDNPGVKQGDKAADKAGDKPADKAADKPATPAKFTYKPSPEGFEVAPEVGDALTVVASELGLSNEAAQKIIDKVSPALQARVAANTKATIEGWITETKAAYGDKLDAEVKLAERALAHSTPELRQLLADPEQGGTGLGYQKAILAGLAAIGRKMSPDAKVVSGAPESPPTSNDPRERLANSYSTTTPS